MGVNVLSLYDGISTGLLAMERVGLSVDNYYAYEIDNNAIKCSKDNWGDKVIQCGDVFKADFIKYKGIIDFLIGGSPCTFWSICQKNNREIEASGMGWNLFSQYLRALEEAKPKFFIYENNQSMHENIRKSICDAFGFEQIEINSALVSAQNRRRYYWVGKRNEDGTYSKVNVELPEDKHIFLKDIIESGLVDRDKSHCLKHQLGNARDYFVKSHTQVAFEPVTINNGCIQVGALPRPNGELSKSQAFRIYSIDGKSVTLKANGGGSGGKTGLYAIPISEEEAQILSDRKVTRIYEVKDEKIWIKGNQYKVKLPDNLYWIRDLNPVECCRLQTMPDNYCKCLPKTLAQKALGNGWTCDVIVHLVKAVMQDERWFENWL